MSPTIALWARSSPWERNLRMRGATSAITSCSTKEKASIAGRSGTLLDLAEADYFHVVPVEEAKGGKYKRNDIVFHLDLQQIAMERRTDMGAGATGPW